MFFDNLQIFKITIDTVKSHCAAIETFSIWCEAKLPKYQEDEWRVPNQSYGSGELAFVPATVGPGWLVCVLGQLQLFQSPAHHLQEETGIAVRDGEKDGKTRPLPNLTQRG